MLTKTQALIMEVFVAGATKKFSIKEIAEQLGKPYPLIHRSMVELIKEGFILRDEKSLLSLNYGANFGELAYVEALRSREVLGKDKGLSLFVKDVFERIGLDFFVFLIFGSYVDKSNPRDVDILMIVEDERKVNEIEKIVVNIVERFSKKIEVQVISVKSAYELLGKRDKINVLNETLNKHILLFGTENYYRMIKNAR